MKSFSLSRKRKKKRQRRRPLRKQKTYQVRMRNQISSMIKIFLKITSALKKSNKKMMQFP